MFFTAAVSVSAATVVSMRDYGVVPGKGDMSARMAKALDRIAAATGKSDVVLVFEPGVYNFYPDKALKAEYYVSNHDQVTPKSVAINLVGWKGLELQGNGAEFLCHGRMLPIALIGSERCTLAGFTVDFADPQVTQYTIVETNDSATVFKPEAWVNWSLDSEGKLTVSGHGWKVRPLAAIAFEPDTRRIAYRTSDIDISGARFNADKKNGTLTSRNFSRKDLPVGTKIVFRSYERPAPALFLSGDTDTYINNVTVHYAEGMGLLAQLCENISLDGFAVRLREGGGRYCTTQADATHFSGCKGHIRSVNGFYENMADDAINVHGTYLRIIAREGDSTLIGRYMHGQSYGFKWGDPGDTVQFVASATMELIGAPAVIKSIEPVDRPTVDGAKEMRVTFDRPLPDTIGTGIKCGMENLEWTPSVEFAHNTVRNNRARGSLFSTPRSVECLANLFDHVAGSAILLCGDCNGWYETGACRDVLIADNTFINPLTSLYQFTEAAISIYPEIPDLKGQSQYFHGGNGHGVVIENNRFALFDAPIVYAKSLDGLRFTGNTVTTNVDYAPFHRNRFTFKLMRVKNAVIEHNSFDRPEAVSIAVDPE